jgi:NTP pyrophosphatase (non-canonical NTP hydrolase)
MFNISDKVRSIGQKALGTWGLDPQMGIMQEECAELIMAISKYKRGLPSNIEEELADVHIMCCQMALAFGERKVKAKVAEKLKRLEGVLLCQKREPSLTIRGGSLFGEGIDPTPNLNGGGQLKVEGVECGTADSWAENARKEIKEISHGSK